MSKESRIEESRRRASSAIECSPLRSRMYRRISSRRALVTQRESEPRRGILHSFAGITLAHESRFLGIEPFVKLPGLFPGKLELLERLAKLSIGPGGGDDQIRQAAPETFDMSVLRAFLGTRAGRDNLFDLAAEVVFPSVERIHGPLVV